MGLPPYIGGLAAPGARGLTSARWADLWAWLDARRTTSATDDEAGERNGADGESGGMTYRLEPGQHGEIFIAEHKGQVPRESPCAGESERAASETNHLIMQGRKPLQTGMNTS